MKPEDQAAKTEANPTITAAPAAPALAAELEKLLEDWYVASFHNSIVSRDTPTINYVRKAVDDLKTRLAAVL